MSETKAALIGRKTEPKVRKSTVIVTSMTISTAHGAVAFRSWTTSISCAAVPPTIAVIPAGGDVLRTARTMLSAVSVVDSAVVTTLMRIVSPCTNWPTIGRTLASWACGPA